MIDDDDGDAVGAQRQRENRRAMLFGARGIQGDH